MKKSDIKELSLKPKPELKRILDEQIVKLRELKFNLAAGKVKNISEIYATRKTIARVSTFLNQE